MGIVQSLTAARMLAIEAASVVAGKIVGENLILTRHDGTEIDAGVVKGSKGDKGDKGDTGAAGITPNRNVILNNRFEVDQKRFYFTDSSLDGSVQVTNRAFGPDRWEAIASFTSPSAVYFSMEKVPLGTLPASGDRCLRLETIGTSQPQSDYTYLQQLIEDVRTFSGKQVTLSFWAKVTTGPTRKISLQFVQNFGSGGSPSAPLSIPAGQVTVTTAWARYSVTVTIPSIVGKTLGTGPATDHISVRMWVSAGSNNDGVIIPLGFQNDKFDFWGFQLEEGAVATNLVTRPKSQELLDCMRYYWTVKPEEDSWVFFPATDILTKGKFDITVPLPVPMRRYPTLTVGQLRVQDGANNLLATSNWVIGTPSGFENMKNFSLVHIQGLASGDPATMSLIIGGTYPTFVSSPTGIAFSAEY